MQKFLYMQCGHSGVDYPEWADNWIDVRKLFSNWFAVRRCGIQMMLEYMGLQFEGNQHCGLDDSRNIARILLQLVNNGCKIKTNSRIKDNMNIIGSRNINKTDRTDRTESDENQENSDTNSRIL